METESNVALELEARSPTENILIKDGDSSIPSSSPNVIASKVPAAVKKQPRQWAAWTRQEEENFFNALRQVGKDFEKITSCVQSKNKDQVRHYYYRLIKRMNKLLGPGFSLDAKNTKDANAAMLRWWSLLEKHSCSASKLHLKPRRFKTFITALGDQLLKDRKKTKRKQPSQDEHGSCTPTMVPSLSKITGSETRSAKMQIVDGENIQKVGSGKGASLKRNVSTGINCGKGDISTTKAARQRRRTNGSVLSTAHKRWEKAATAGVSLVAEAAEQLERTINEQRTANEKCFLAQRFTNELPHESPSNRLTDIGLTGKICHSLPSITSEAFHLEQLQIMGTSSVIVETEGPSLEPAQSIQPTVKLKLQLFPIDEDTRKGLEKDERNPYLELTLSARKKISSVLEHLNRKWGSSSIASGEIMLFPYSAQQESLAIYKRWTLKDTISSAADVYATIGSPAVFRLRYGWFSNAENCIGTPQIPFRSLNFEDCLQCEKTGEEYMVEKIASGNNASFQLISPKDKQRPSDSSNAIVVWSGPLDAAPPETVKPDGTIGSFNQIMELPENHGTTDEKMASSPRFTCGTEHVMGIVTDSKKECGDGIVQKAWDDADALKTSNGIVLSAGEWADSLTTISVGDLFSEASRAAADAKCPDIAPVESATCVYHIPFNSDSFDAAIAAHLSAPRDIPVPSLQASIWDAEVTCDAFAFQKMRSVNRDLPSSSISSTFGVCSQATGFSSLIEDFEEVGHTEAPDCRDELKANSQCNVQSRDDVGLRNCGITDIYWPDSLGPLDLALSSFRYQSQDVIAGDSVSLSGLIASSLDAFQNCSFFGTERKGSSTYEA